MSYTIVIKKVRVRSENRDVATAIDREHVTDRTVPVAPD